MPLFLHLKLRFLTYTLDWTLETVPMNTVQRMFLHCSLILQLQREDIIISILTILFFNKILLLWSLANIKSDGANITCGAAVILHGPAIILRGMTRICCNVHDILHFQHQFFEIFLSVFGIFKGKNTLFSKSAQKMV